MSNLKLVNPLGRFIWLLLGTAEFHAPVSQSFALQTVGGSQGYGKESWAEFTDTVQTNADWKSAVTQSETLHYET